MTSIKALGKGVVEKFLDGNTKDENQGKGGLRRKSGPPKFRNKRKDRKELGAGEPVERRG